MISNTIQKSWCLVIPLANEEKTINILVKILQELFTKLGSGRAYFIVDAASRDSTWEIVQKLSIEDPRLCAVWATHSKNVVDAYLHGFREAIKEEVDFIIEMDGGLSHNPWDVPKFLEALANGYDVAFGSRFVSGGGISSCSLFRFVLSYYGTKIANLVLGTSLYDMTSGFQGFSRQVMLKLLDQPLRATGHIYQTEVRYLCRNLKVVEIPISYSSPSPSVKFTSIKNAIGVTLYYFLRRITGNSDLLSLVSEPEK